MRFSFQTILAALAAVLVSTTAQAIEPVLDDGTIGTAGYSQITEQAAGPDPQVEATNLREAASLACATTKQDMTDVKLESIPACAVLTEMENTFWQAVARRHEVWLRIAEDAVEAERARGEVAMYDAKKDAVESGNAYDAALAVGTKAKAVAENALAAVEAAGKLAEAKVAKELEVAQSGVNPDEFVKRFDELIAKVKVLTDKSDRQDAFCKFNQEVSLCKASQ